MLTLPRFIAHRGANRSAPENTLAAMRLAQQQGATWVEFDLRLTQDQQVIVFHDDTLARTTNGQGAVADKAWANIQALDAGSWFNPMFKNERVPHLLELLDCLAELKLGMNLELKPEAGQEESLVKAMLTVLNNFSKALPPLVISSFNFTALQILQQHQINYPIGLLFREWNSAWLNQVNLLPSCISIHLHEKLITHDRVQLIHQAGYQVMSYTVNEHQQAQQFFNCGVNGLFTDNLSLLGETYDQ